MKIGVRVLGPTPPKPYNWATESTTSRRNEHPMTTFVLVTSTDRVLEVESGQPVTSLARNETISSVKFKDRADTATDGDLRWLRTIVAPLMGHWGETSLGGSL